VGFVIQMQHIAYFKPVDEALSKEYFDLSWDTSRFRTLVLELFRK
jgi:hypothetical protein